MTSVLVTGGAGFIGSHLVDSLVKAGRRVRVLDSLVRQVHPQGEPDYLNAAVDYRWGDVRDRLALRAALEDMDVVVHLAAAVGVGQSMYEVAHYLENNVVATGILWEEMLTMQDRIRRVVVASSMSLYGEGATRCAECGPVSIDLRSEAQLKTRSWEPICPQCDRQLESVPTTETWLPQPTSVYAVSKRDQEEVSISLGRAYGVPTVALRFFNAYGPRQSLSNPYTGVCAIFLSRLKADQPPIVYEDGLQTRDFVHVNDIVQAIQLAMDPDSLPDGVYNVGSGSGVSILEIAKILGRSLGVLHEPQVTNEFRAGDIRHCSADIDRLAQFGFRPLTDLEEGLRDLATWSRSAPSVDLAASAEAELRDRNLVA